VQIGTDVQMLNTGNGNQYGNHVQMEMDGDGIRYGNYTLISGIGTGKKYGTYNIIQPTAGGTHYGVYSTVKKANSYAGYFLGDVYLGTSTTNGYKLPSTDGTANQVLTTDGNGQTNWQAPSVPTGVVPVGSIIAWHGTSAGVALSSEWQLCDGSAISDATSPMNGQNTPDLNGNTRSVSENTFSSSGTFLRGSSISGTFQGDQSNHLDTVILSSSTSGASSIILDERGNPSYLDSDIYISPSNRYEFKLEGRETRPTNMSVIWIMRIK